MRIRELGSRQMRIRYKRDQLSSSRACACADPARASRNHNLDDHKNLSRILYTVIFSGVFFKLITNKRTL